MTSSGQSGSTSTMSVCRAGHADVLHLEAGGRGAVAVRDPQRGRPGRLLVVGGIRQGVQRRRDPVRQPLHVVVDVGPEPRLAQATLVVDEEAVAGASGRHDDAVHPITIAERRPREPRSGPEEQPGLGELGAHGAGGEPVEDGMDPIGPVRRSGRRRAAGPGRRRPAAPGRASPGPGRCRRRRPDPRTTSSTRSGWAARVISARRRRRSGRWTSSPEVTVVARASPIDRKAASASPR